MSDKAPQSGDLDGDTEAIDESPALGSVLRISADGEPATRKSEILLTLGPLAEPEPIEALFSKREEAKSAAASMIAHTVSKAEERANHFETNCSQLQSELTIAKVAIVRYEERHKTAVLRGIVSIVAMVSLAVANFTKGECPKFSLIILGVGLGLSAVAILMILYYFLRKGTN